ncbi:MAG TPA: polysaccharide pyruvyl transferase family protein [Planctomycetota bacterium]|nr:polysaccharide pyruvyl transferase family protein [Planctomycetota bacterium]
MRILITNTVALNGGDAAILHGLLRIVHDAFGDGVEVTIYDSHADVAARYYPALRFRRQVYPSRGLGRVPGLRRTARAMRTRLLLSAARLRARGHAPRWAALLGREDRRDLDAYARADLVISTGGTYLVENYDLAPRIFDFRFTLALERPLFLFTQSLGPFADPDNREALRPIFEQAVRILLRDERSREHLLDLGVPAAKLAVTADAAFALAERSTLEAAGARRAGSPLRVAISVRDWAFFRGVGPGDGMHALRSAVGALVRHLVVEHGAEVTFLSTCQGIPEYWTDDARVAREIVAELPAAVRMRVAVDGGFRGPEAMLRELRSYDIVVAMRLHMGILSLCAGTPVFPIAYEFKTRELFEELGLGRHVQDVNSMEGGALCRACDDFLADLGGFRARLFAAVLTMRERALASAHELRRAAR